VQVPYVGAAVGKARCEDGKQTDQQLLTGWLTLQDNVVHPTHLSFFLVEHSFDYLDKLLTESGCSRGANSNEQHS
jgi:hypothetical protein